MKIGIDARQISHARRHGLRTYVENLVRSLSRLDRKNQYILYLDAKDRFDLSGLGSNFSLKILPWKIRYLSTLFNDRFLLPFHIKKDGVDIIHYASNPVNILTSVKTLVSVHDALPFMGRRISFVKGGIRQGLYNRHLASLIQKASGKVSSILTPSRNSKKDLLKFLKVHPEKIRAIHFAAGKHFRRIQDESSLRGIKERYHLGDRFILGFAHKNGTRIALACKKLPEKMRERYRAGLISTSNRFQRDLSRVIKAHCLEDRVVCIPPVSDEELNLLYNAASLFVFPSFYEGFGFPVLEAMKCGCPVLCSNRGSLPEVAGEAALYIQELDNADLCASGIAENVTRMMDDQDLKKSLIDKGYAQAESFTWEKTAGETLKVYEEI